MRCESRRCQSDEIESLRECTGALQWLARESRPDLAVQVNMSQHPGVRVCRRANNVVSRAVPHHGLGIRILPIPSKQLRLVLHSDAAFQNARGGASQSGHVVASTDDGLAHL